MSAFHLWTIRRKAQVQLHKTGRALGERVPPVTIRWQNTKCKLDNSLSCSQRRRTCHRLRLYLRQFRPRNGEVQGSQTLDIDRPRHTLTQWFMHAWTSSLENLKKHPVQGRTPNCPRSNSLCPQRQVSGVENHNKLHCTLENCATLTITRKTLCHHKTGGVHGDRIPPVTFCW